MRATLCLVLAAVGAAAGADPAGVAELQRAWERPPDDARILMRWWWFGPAVTKAGLEVTGFLRRGETGSGLSSATWR